MPSYLKKFFAPLQRARHALGFGVHSPFAFRFITEVLCPPRIYGYYIYDVLKQRELRLLYRVVLSLRPQTVALPGHDELLCRVIAAAMPGVYFTEAAEEAELTVFDAAKFPEHRPPQPGKHAFILNSGYWERYRSFLATPSHMTFASPRVAIAIGYPHLPPQHFDVRL